jgi:hypothetical protein
VDTGRAVDQETTVLTIEDANGQREHLQQLRIALLSRRCPIRERQPEPSEVRGLDPAPSSAAPSRSEISVRTCVHASRAARSRSARIFGRPERATAPWRRGTQVIEENVFIRASTMRIGFFGGIHFS